MTGTLKSC